MKAPNLSKAFNTAKRVIVKHSPEILTGIGIAGMVTTTILAVKATPKALQLIEEKKKELWVDDLKPVDTIKATWKCYIPPAITGVLSISCIIGGTSVSLRRNAALATACKIAETSLVEYKDYRKKIVEAVGEKKEQKVRDEMSKEKLENNPVSNSQVYITSNGNTLCYEAISGRYFRSDINQIRKAINELNKQMIDDMYISLSEYFIKLDLKPTSNSDSLGWCIDDGLLDIDLSSQLADDGTPCVVVNMLIPPKYDFNMLG